MDYSAAERAIIWLSVQEKLDYATKVALLRAAGDPARLFSDFEKLLKGVINSGQERVYMNDGSSREREADELVKQLNAADVFAVTLASDDYPKLLTHVFKPPLVLYGKGNRALLEKRKFTIVGSRSTPAWAEKQAKLFSAALSERFVIVTGFAEGGDRAAVDGALESGNLICVLPLGLDGCYPAAHASLKRLVERKGLLLSEYPLKTTVRKHHFGDRNRILAGLSEGTLMVSAKANKSGVLMTARATVEYGRQLFAFPYNLGVEAGAGCNQYIKEGASLATDVEDILSYFGFDAAPKQAVELTDKEAQILVLLREEGELHTAVIASRTGYPVYEVVATLSSLEMKNLAVKAGGNRYSAV